MKIHVATATAIWWNAFCKSEFEAVASLDCVGKHVLTDDPESADIIIFPDFHQHLDDWWMGDFHRHPLVTTYPEKICVYDERDEPRFSAPGIYVSLSRDNMHAGSQCSGCYFTMRNEMVRAASQAAREPDLLFSFMGSMSHPIRHQAMKLSHLRAVVEDTSNINFFATDNDSERQKQIEQQKERYREVVGRSKFVLCPRGFGTSSYRVFETLALGRVPVILSDDWVPPPGPEWQKCALFVPEADILSVPRILEEREGDSDELAANAETVWKTWFAPEVRFNTLVEACIALREAGAVGVCRYPKLQPAALRFGLRLMKRHLKTRLSRR